MTLEEFFESQVIAEGDDHENSSDSGDTDQGHRKLPCDGDTCAFINPMVDPPNAPGMMFRLDYCSEWGKYCGFLPALDFCESKGFDTVYGYKIAEDIGPWTFLPKVHMFCNYSWCDGFEYITCGPCKPGMWLC